jgi:sigma-B regulation protein RsbU (phosphoserine phosphatase)
MARLNRFLYENTEANRYVTLFYAELDPVRRTLGYVNAGHVPPFWIRADGRSSRLEEGGPVLGLLGDPPFARGEVTIGRGELVAMVTDGATEAASAKDEEFGDVRVAQALAAARGSSASEILSGLLATVEGWTGAAGCSDDLTALLLKAL